jgi:hypothetical protein
LDNENDLFKNVRWCYFGRKLEMQKITKTPKNGEDENEEE